MHIHILGICGTFMGGVALLARELGFQVSGADTNVYPPMSTQLEEHGILLHDGYDDAQFTPTPDLVVIGNALSRGNAAVEYVLNRGLPYTSGPAFLTQKILQQRWVLAVAGTHGKTTTSCMLAWILDYADLAPGFLIGGAPLNFGVSARLGDVPFFVVEADEYDTAFFDKRSKFVHYRPRTVIMNNLEFDHADIFDDLDAIKRQFHHLVRTVPETGLIVAPSADENLEHVFEQGCWTPIEHFSDAQAAAVTNNDWSARNISADGSQFDVYSGDTLVKRLEWGQIGRHNVLNALAAIAAARHAGVMPEHAVAALAEFKGVKRRMELRASINGVTIYDDFAHHPTAITSTLQGLRKHAGQARIIVVFEPRSNTMRMGVHKDRLIASFRLADLVMLYQAPDLPWQWDELVSDSDSSVQIYTEVAKIVDEITGLAQPGDHVLIMSNGAFGGIHQKLIAALDHRGDK